jgi:hypothetical protein
MAYGDGGFYFLQPVNNGYGAIDFTPSSYGATTKDKKYGKYNTYHQWRDPRSRDEQTADLQTLGAHLVKLSKKLRALKRSIVETKQKINRAPGLSGISERAKLTAALKKQNWALANLKRAVSRMQSNIEKAKEQAANQGETARAKAEGAFQVSSADEQLPFADFTALVASPASADDEYIVGSVAGDIPSEGEILSDVLLAPVEETFYQQHKTPIMLAAGGIGVVAIVMLLRK